MRILSNQAEQVRVDLGFGPDALKRGQTRNDGVLADVRPSAIRRRRCAQAGDLIEHAGVKDLRHLRLRLLKVWHAESADERLVFEMRKAGDHFTQANQFVAFPFGTK